MYGLYYMTWAAALSPSQALTVAGNPALIGSTNAAAPGDMMTSSSKSGSPLVSSNTSLQVNQFNYHLDQQKPLCETATYINVIDVMAYLALRPSAELEDNLAHQESGRVYGEVIITIYGQTPTFKFVRRDALNGLFASLQRLGGQVPSEKFYALVQETIGPDGTLLMTLKIDPAEPLSMTQATLPLTQRSNITDADGLCNESLATATPEGSQNPDVTESAVSAPSITDIDTVLQSSSSAASANSSNGANDGWFSWPDPNVRNLQFRCRFLGGPEISWYEAYMPFARSVSSVIYRYEKGPGNPAQALDAYIKDMRIRIRVGGYPSGKEPNAAFTNKLAILSLRRVPRIFAEKRTWKGIQVQVVVEGNPVGVMVLVKDMPASITNAASQGSVDVT